MVNGTDLDPEGRLITDSPDPDPQHWSKTDIFCYCSTAIAVTVETFHYCTFMRNKSCKTVAKVSHKLSRQGDAAFNNLLNLSSVFFTSYF